jgi:SHS2 domain-containing protein
MPYEYLDDIATSDVAFRAWGQTLEEMFVAAADATMNVMVADLNTIARRKQLTLRVESDAIDMLLFELLQEIIFYKDAEQLLLRVPEVFIIRRNEIYSLEAETCGERLDPKKHDLVVDVKAVTLHRYRVDQTVDGWEAMIILDI